MLAHPLGKASLILQVIDSIGQQDKGSDDTSQSTGETLPQQDNFKRILI